MNRLLFLAAAVSVLLASVPSYAATFDFSFTNQFGIAALGATVTGEIEGLSANGNSQAASAIYITGDQSGLINSGDLSTYDLLANRDGSYSYADSFNVTNGQITSVTLQVYDAYNSTNFGGGLLELYMVTGGTYILQEFTTAESEVVASSVTFSEISSTPLPPTWTMLIAGLVGLGFFACRGTKNGAAAIAAA
jgi:hypothetical protein